MIEASRIYLLRTARLELLVAIAGVAVLGGVELWTGLQVAGVDIDPGCLLQVARTCDPTLVAQYSSAFANSSLIQAGGLGLAVAVSALLGTVAIASELESGTVQTAWSLDRRRARWFRSRIFAFGGAVVALLLVLALASHWFEGLRRPMFDPGASFQAYRFRGPALVGVALATFGVASLVGAALGRTLPSLVVALGIGLGLVGLGHLVIFPNLAEPVPLLSDAPDTPDAVVASRYLDASGSYLTLDMVKARSPYDTAKQEFWDWASTTFREVAAGYEGRSYWTIALRELAVWTVVTAVLLVTTWGLVRRRRPT